MFQIAFVLCRALRRNAGRVEGASSTLKLTESLEKENMQSEESAGRCTSSNMVGDSRGAGAGTLPGPRRIILGSFVAKQQTVW